MATSRRRNLETAVEVEPEVRAQLQFYGEGTAELILRNLKLGTCRVSNDKYTFTPGQIVEGYCRDDNEARIPLIILNVLKKVYLGGIPLSVLSLDGFFDFDQAEEDLKRFYPNFDMVTEVDYITFMTLDRFQKYGSKTQENLITKPIRKLLEDRSLRGLFFPSIAFWMGVRGGNTSDYHEFLIDEELAQEAEIEKFMSVLSLPGRNKRSQNQIILRLDNLTELAQLADPTDPLYAWAILLHKPV